MTNMYIAITIIFILVIITPCPGEEQVTATDQYKDEPIGNNVYFSPAFLEGLDKSRSDEEYDDILSDLVDDLDKRAPSWNNLRIGSGKRAPSWNNLRIGSGKRSPSSWNNLRIGSGKRSVSPESWNKLSGLIGKRSIGWNRINSSWGKRDPQWNTMSSGWGKRGWNDMSSAIGKRMNPNGIAHWNNMRGMWGK